MSAGILVVTQQTGALAMNPDQPDPSSYVSKFAPTPSLRNRLLNGNFAVNQRGVTSASVAYPAYAYLLDRWQAGPDGVTLSYATAGNGDVTVTITAGMLRQVIEGGLYLPEGGTHTLSWVGTAQGRVAGLSVFGPSPQTVQGVAPGTLTAIEFQAGTLSLAQFERGDIATPFERRDGEVLRCRRYYRSTYSPGVAPGTPNAATPISRFIDPPSYYPTTANVLFDQPMRVAPTVTLYSQKTGAPGKVYGWNVDTDINAAPNNITPNGFSVMVTNVSTSYEVRTCFTASAEI